MNSSEDYLTSSPHERSKTFALLSNIDPQNSNDSKENRSKSLAHNLQSEMDDSNDQLMQREGADTGNSPPKNGQDSQRQNILNQGHDEEQSKFVQKPEIVSVEMAPDWLRDNEYLLNGYRVNYNRKRDLFKSLFSLHNETLNIWTHLVGAIIFVILSIYIGFYFDVAKKIFFQFVKDFKKIDIGSMVKKSVDHDIVPLIDALKKYVSKDKDKESLMRRAVYFQKNFETLIHESKQLNQTRVRSNKDLVAVNRFYWIIAQIKQLTTTLSSKTHLPSIKDTKELLKVLTLTNAIDDLETWPILLYIFTAVFCLGSSTTFHWFHPKNERVFKILNRIDLASIAILIWGSAVSVIYYYFYCNRVWFYFTSYC